MAFESPVYTRKEMRAKIPRHIVDYLVHKGGVRGVYSGTSPDLACRVKSCEAYMCVYECWSGTCKHSSMFEEDVDCCQNEASIVYALMRATVKGDTMDKENKN